MLIKLDRQKTITPNNYIINGFDYLLELLVFQSLLR